MSDKKCKECTLPVTEYKTVKQTDPDICEACHLTKMVDRDYVPEDVKERDNS